MGKSKLPRLNISCIFGYKFLKVWHPEYPRIEEDDEWNEEPEDTEVMKDDREAARSKADKTKDRN